MQMGRLLQWQWSSATLNYIPTPICDPSLFQGMLLIDRKWSSAFQMQNSVPLD
jgi:hypothetical protein